MTKPNASVAFGLDERAIASWQCKAGQHAKQVQEQLVCQGRIDLGQVQADELYTSGWHAGNGGRVDRSCLVD